MKSRFWKMKNLKIFKRKSKKFFKFQSNVKNWFIKVRFWMGKKLLRKWDCLSRILLFLCSLRIVF